MRTSSRYENGFTVIELLISLVIMGFVFSLGFANYRSYASRQKIEGATREIKADLRLAQQEAVAGKKPVDDVGTTVPECDDSVSDFRLDGYEVRYVDPTTYEIYAICTGGDVLIKSVGLLEKYPDIQIQNFSPFQFRVLAEGVNTARTLTIQEYDDTTIVATRQIQITQGGQVN